MADERYYDFTQVAEQLQRDFNRTEAMQGVEQFVCRTSGTTHAITGGMNSFENTVFKFTADADYNKNYTTTVNGTAVQCLLPNNDEVQNNFFRSGASVLCMLDATNNKLYFVGGGSGAGGNYFFNRGITTWASDSTYSDYPYRGTISITGVTDADGVEVTFSNADATSGNYSPVCETFNGGVYIWSKTNNANLVIPTICIYGRSNEDLDGEFPYLSLNGGTVRGDVTVTGNLTAENIGSYTSASGKYTTAAWATGTNTCTWTAPADGTYIVWMFFALDDASAANRYSYKQLQMVGTANKILGNLAGNSLYYDATTTESAFVQRTISQPITAIAGQTIYPYVHTSVAGIVYTVKIVALRIA